MYVHVPTFLIESSSYMYDDEFVFACQHWSTDFQLPSTVWLAGLFNPQSFLTAIMQQTARKNEWPLDKMALQCDVSKKTRDDIASAPREGAYIHGLYMEGAR